jgi:NAD(P)-dependent dehydrogenase (short-subunit alcohol dehydrogenase family)
MKTFQNKIAVITGAASGIGRALAVALTQAGARLALLDHDPGGLAATRAACAGADVEIYEVDVANREQVDAAAARVAERFGAVDIAVNNAGVSSSGLIHELTYETLAWTMSVNFWGVVHGTKAFLPLLAARTESSLVNVSSVFGLIGVPGQAAYCASKFAVRGFTEAVRQDLRGGPIAVTLVLPGGVHTAIVRNSRTDSTLPLERQQRLRDDFEASLRTSPEEAARAILAGIRTKAKRVLIGKDARSIDLLVRLRPTGYDAAVAADAERRRRRA